MAIVTKGQIEKSKEILRDIEQYISPMVVGANEKFQKKSVKYVKVRPGDLKRCDICYYGFDREEYVKVNYSFAYIRNGVPSSYANGFSVSYIIDICADIEDLIYHPEDLWDIKEGDTTKAKTISLRPIDPITKMYLCETAVREDPIVKEYYVELMRIVEKAQEYVKKYYKNVYVGSHYSDISVCREACGEPEQYKEYFMDMALLAKTKKNYGHTVEKITEFAKRRCLELNLTIDEVKKHIDFKTNHGYEWIGPFNKILDTERFEYLGYSQTVSNLLSVEEFANALYPDRPKKITYDDGSLYEGEIKNNVRHGQGTYLWKSGDKYVGEWKNGKRDGKGTMYYASGKKYVGEWKKSELHGEGIVYYNDGTSKKLVYNNGTLVSTLPNNIRKTYDDGSWYEGEMKDGIRHGQGTYFWKSGDKYVGEWKNGKRDGKGTMYYASGKKYIGEWKKSELHGEGIIYYKNGVKEKCVFNSGKRINKK